MAPVHRSPCAVAGSPRWSAYIRCYSTIHLSTSVCGALQLLAWCFATPAVTMSRSLGRTLIWTLLPPMCPKSLRLCAPWPPSRPGSRYSCHLVGVPRLGSVWPLTIAPPPSMLVAALSLYLLRGVADSVSALDDWVSSSRYQLWRSSPRPLRQP